MSSDTAKVEKNSGLQPTRPSNTPLLYRGRRILVIDNAQRHLDEDYDIVVWDKLLDCAVGFCKRNADGTFSGWVAYGQHQLTISGEDPRELARSALLTVNWTLRN